MIKDCSKQVVVCFLFFRMKQHYENYEPTLKALRQKYEVRFIIFLSSSDNQI